MSSAETEFDYWADLHAKTPLPVIADSVMPIVEAKRFETVGDNGAIGDHVRILPTPGHAGPRRLRFGCSRDEAVFSGDLMQPPLQTRYPELSPSSTSTRLGGENAARLPGALLRHGYLCCTAHFPSPSVGRIRRKGDGSPARQRDAGGHA